MMFDVQKQTQVMHARLAKYKTLLPLRDAAYRRRKLKFSIPRTQIALARMQSGLYGICTDCEEEIDTKRLEAVPAALLCIECQREFEERAT